MTPESQQRVARLETRAMFPYLIKVTFPDGEVKRYVNCDEDKTFENEVYTASFFMINPPEETETGIKDASITISALDNYWLEKIRTNDGRCRCRFVAVIDYDRNGQEYIEPLSEMLFWLEGANWNDKTISFTMKYDDKMDVQMPCQKFSQFSAPALY